MSSFSRLQRFSELTEKEAIARVSMLFTIVVTRVKDRDKGELGMSYLECLDSSMAPVHDMNFVPCSFTLFMLVFIAIALDIFMYFKNY